MKRYGLYAAAICTAAVVGVGGCAATAKGDSTELQSETAVETTKEESTTVVEPVSGAIESAEGSQPEKMEAVRIYGPVTHMEDGRLSIDNQSDASSAGEIILNVSQESTYVLDAVSGMPMALEDIRDGDTVYAYIGPAMTMSLPPMTNAAVIFANIPADFKVPDYVEVKSVVTDAQTSHTVLTGADGTEYTLSEDCEIFPYLTRNIVTLDDLTQGRKAAVWSDEDNTATRIMVFAE